MMDEEPPEERYKALIGVGIAFSILIFIGIVVTLGVTKGKIASRYAEESSYPLALADTSYTSTSAEDEYYRGSALTLSEESDSLRQEILSNCTNCDDKKKFLDHLETETDQCAILIRELASKLGDTMSIPGVTGTRAVSRDFFANTELDEQLFSALFSYRENTEELSADAGIDSPVEFRNLFPLRETFSEYDYAQTWSDEKLEQEPADVMIFLHNLEIDLRKYENRLLYEL